MKFRKDINGLRAIAVIGVVLFHFNPVLLPGGFAGVDVFFVISGFLMTSIIFRGIERGDISILKFYQSRAKRIIPAIVVLCAVLMIFGFVYLTLTDYKTLAKHSASSISFVSNILYLSESGYFDASSHEKWLLHTWSLSVEWQFYIIYPLVLLAIKRYFSLQNLKLFVLLGAMLSFLFCIYLTYKDSAAAYYILPTRAWEMLLGGLAFLFPLSIKDSRRRPLELVGLFVIVASFFLVDSKTPWPGYVAFFPVIGTYFVIQSNSQGSLLTGNYLFEKIGLWSYSIYLWHWPLVVLFYFQSKNNSIGIILSIALGCVSYSLIEKKGSWLKKLFGAIVLLMPFFILSGFDGADRKTAKFLENELAEFRYGGYSNPSCNFRPFSLDGQKKIDNLTIEKNCYAPLDDKINVLIYGDSHAQHLYYGLTNLLSSSFNVLQIAGFGCNINNFARDSCAASNSLFLEKIDVISPDILIVAMRNGFEDVNWDDFLKKVNSVPRVLILGPSPEINTKSLIYTGLTKVTNDAYMESIDSLMQNNKFISEWHNVEYVSMKSLICDGDSSKCPAVMGDKILYADSGHFSRDGSIYVVDRLLKLMGL